MHFCILGINFRVISNFVNKKARYARFFLPIVNEAKWEWDCGGVVFPLLQELARISGFKAKCKGGFNFLKMPFCSAAAATLATTTASCWRRMKAKDLHNLDLG